MKKARKKKKESTSQQANKHSGGVRCETKQAKSTKISIYTLRMTSEQGRQFDKALDLLLAELVRQVHEGKGTSDGEE